MCLKTHVSFTKIGLDAAPQTYLLCILCNEVKPAAEVTAGSLYADGHQAFACNSHAWNKSKWLRQWAVFQSKKQMLLHPISIPPANKSTILETRPVPRLTDLANDVAYHLQMHTSEGKILIVAERPAVFLSILRRRWMKIIRILQRERASTLDAPLIEQLLSNIKAMQSLRFVCDLPSNQPDADVFVLTLEQASSAPQKCTALYICHEDIVVDVTQWQFGESAVIVMYR